MKTENLPLSLIVCLYTFSLCLAQDGITVTTPAGTQHEMVLVPEGEFTMGSHAGSFYNGEIPEHKVYLDAYYIDKFEVTNALYDGYMRANDRVDPLDAHDTEFKQGRRHQNRIESLYAHDTRFNSPQQPVVGVSWSDAVHYCIWAGMRLPTNAEWEKAARGPQSLNYPWGDHWVNLGGNYMITEDGYQYTAPVGSFPAGVSPYGGYDMAGNVSEWVMDRRSVSYYSRSPYRNPQGPGSEEPDDGTRIIRGGDWHSAPLQLQSWFSHGGRKVGRYKHIGFRCVRSATVTPNGAPTVITPESWGEIKAQSR